ncbi:MULTISPECIES: hypothetical protein [Sphingobium]|jgi:hypothetical protein|uniref:hypothetical protein n=1 Tax=Sphingobium TaxID=165695 RepID=UPI000C407FF8|nr:MULTISPECIES: hypothetical protein [Sphingobium]MAP43766.1 hypothetical protein [Sphingobium sp.]MEE2740358.1 hypothetical protein [Pseudomonadota bacterium]MAX15922.1 hypothetical protein [Sphingobium sp.]MBS50485.1 hypothetical protein [Sphingobium sp.]MCC4256379.1 hypothetical protein [Sphingobium lactosutens]|tara:strand:+ start:206 stop:442 length:237 start_codon:yes stop_codon:yes gene_type:complete
MALIGWILSFTCLFAGLALRQDLPIGGSVTISNLLIIFALLACPIVWRELPIGVSRGQRIIAGLALVFALPIILFPTH